MHARLKRQIVLQLFVSAVIFCVGSVMRAGEFKVVQMHLWTRDQPYQPSFRPYLSLHISIKRLEDLALLDIRKKRREYKLKRGTIAQTKT